MPLPTPRALSAQVPLPRPKAGAGTCASCRGPAPLGRPQCWPCARIDRALRTPCPPVAAVAVYRPGDQAHAALRGYKDSPLGAARERFSRHLTDTLGDFLGAHGGCMVDRWGDVDAVCTVPTRRRGGGGGGDPLAAVTDAVPWLAALPRLRLAPGPGPVGHLVASPAAYTRVGAGHGRRVLVVDDTWTTGAHARSAAAALSRAGDRVVGVLVIGRCVNPAVSPVAGSWWRAAAAAAVRGGHGGTAAAVDGTGWGVPCGSGACPIVGERLTVAADHQPDGARAAQALRRLRVPVA